MSLKIYTYCVSLYHESSSDESILINISIATITFLSQFIIDKMKPDDNKKI